jgi:tryptophan-rich sensory protein
MYVTLIGKFFESLSTQASIMSMVGLWAFGCFSMFYANYLRGSDMMADYATLKLPSFAPPSWAFGILWNIIYIVLYILIGVGFGSILTGETRGILNLSLDIRSFLIVWFILQYALNFAWSLVYYGCNRIEQSKYLILLLWVFVSLMTIVSFVSGYYLAGCCFIPYALWTGYGSLLQWHIAKLNPNR